MKKIISLAFVITIAGCSLPTTRITTGTSRPTLTILGAPDIAVLYVDGLAVGSAAQYNGSPQTLLIEEGVHQVEIRQGTLILMSQKIFTSNGENSKLVYKSENTK